MKVKKSMFAKLLALALPMAAISVVTPIVLTSCGSSTSETNKTQASWDTTKTQDGLTFNAADNSAVITLGDSAFASTGISKASTFDNIKSSLDPNSTAGKSLYSVLSGAIKDINDYNVKLLLNTNPVVFDYSNGPVGNYFEGQFQLTPKSGTNAAPVNLNFRVNNFNDSYNGDANDTSKQLTWNVNKIQEAFKSTASTGNKLPEVTPKSNGASVTINLKDQLMNNKQVGLGNVMDELCNTTITGAELNSFIGGDTNDYDVANAKISAWAPTVDSKMVFTRVVIPNKDSSKQAAIMYIAYTGYSIDKDDGNPSWNRNISYPGNANLWDSTYKEPVIDLSQLNGTIGNTSISKDSTYENITNRELITPLVKYMSDNYVMESNKFSLCFTGIIGDNGNGGYNNTIVPGTFKDGVFSKGNISKDNKQNSSNPLNGNAVEFKFFLQLKEGHDSTSTNKGPMGSAQNSPKGFWKSFYIINYKDSDSSTK